MTGFPVRKGRERRGWNQGDPEDQLNGMVNVPIKVV
jgi:hypothetical protein